ncbi:molecular chaperone [Vibrio sp. D404a]|uniref:molecular chaperone n=1 Tax=unclassified Vibrio TaxID=2614977 RepID=UPI002557B141|nr:MULTISPECIES: molecular chaperone [unclassified Vibrio]MDK9737279.1 molecular chaperone [Vibrio sp. D404a]MDK9798045.1 molecular chaperone [Vibrio sp. D449a]
MFIGFDYGTANCSVAAMIEGAPRLLPLEGDNHYIPSTVFAPTRESVSEHLFRHLNIKPSDAIGEQVLRRAIAANREESIDLVPEDMAFGQAALDLYLEDPRDVYYVKSPKSFLGASGLHDVQVSFFEDLVCAMMANIKQQAERSTQCAIQQAVIGRPINFHGRGGEEANQQAERILTRAATRAGFSDIAFQFEPVAAGLEYESTLTRNQTVLVVDIGGGTTDCSLLEMGPSWAGHVDRSASLLAHSGQRVGGNDLDIYLAFKRLMQPFGMTSKSTSGIDMPLTQFWNPIAINNVEAQKNFYSRENLAALKLLRKEAAEPEKLDRLMRVYHDTLGYSIIRRAEEAKIALAESNEYRTAIQVASELVEVDISVGQMVEAIDAPKAKMIELVTEAIQQGQKKPDVIYMTGGSARSPILRQAVEQAVPNVPIVSGNYFGSVTAGLARWAETCFK